MIGIYKYENLINGKIYVGQAQDIAKRYKEHLKGWKYKQAQHIDKAIHRYGIKNFKFSILQKFDQLDRDILNQAEIYWVNYYDCYNSPIGYNHREPGDAMGIDDIARAKHRMNICGERNGMYGKTHTAEARRKISEGHKGKMLGESNPNYGNHALAGGNNPSARKVRCIDLDIIFDTVNEAGVWAGAKGVNPRSTIIKCCKGQIPRAYGYHWEYVE